MCFIFLSACSKTIVQSKENINADIMQVYFDYLKSIEGGNLPNDISIFYSKKSYDSLIKLYPSINNKDLEWHIYSSHVPKSYIDQSFFKKIDQNQVCVTVTGKSHEKTPKYVNLLFIKEEAFWKIDTFASQFFYDGVKPSFPDQGTCPKKPEDL